MEAFAREYFDGDPREGRPNGHGSGTSSAGCSRARGPRPRQGLISMPRGNGKTSLAAVLGAYGLYADGVEGAEVVVVVTGQPYGAEGGLMGTAAFIAGFLATFAWARSQHRAALLVTPQHPGS